MSSVGLNIHRLEPQSARGRARVAKILDAAADLFLEVGYEQTSIDAILLRSGGSKSTLYAYFPTKQDSFRSVIDAVVDKVRSFGGQLDELSAIVDDLAVERINRHLASHPPRDFTVVTLGPEALRLGE